MLKPHRSAAVALSRKEAAAPGTQLMTLESSAHVIRNGELARYYSRVSHCRGIASLRHDLGLYGHGESAKSKSERG